MATVNIVGLEAIRAFGQGKKNVFCVDMDETVRRGKQDPNRATTAAVTRAMEDNLVIPITGGPLRHVPLVFQESVPVLAETGAVLQLPGGGIQVLTPREKQSALQSLRTFLGLTKEEGLDYIQGTRAVILEGPRYASATLVTGKHPDYEEQTGGNPSEETIRVYELLELFVAEYDFYRRIGNAKDRSYAWNDVYPYDKAEVVGRICRMFPEAAVYYFGDGANDLQAMRLQGVTPVVFSNSVAPLHEIAQEKGGIIVDKPGPEGGVVQALELIEAKGGQ